MSIRTILAAVSGGSASAGAIGLGCYLARRFDAHLEGFHVMPDPAAVLVAAGEEFAVPASAGLAEAMMEQASVQAKRARALFEDLISQHGIARHAVPQLAPHRPSASWHEETGSAAGLVAERGRFYDLVVQSDVGLVDVAWGLKDERTSTVSKLINQQKLELKTVEEDFRALMEEEK